MPVALSADDCEACLAQLITPSTYIERIVIFLPSLCDSPSPWTTVLSMTVVLGSCSPPDASVDAIRTPSISF